MNNYEKYLSEQMLDPEFRVQYAFAREKAKLEIYMEKLKEDINKGANKKILIKRLNHISKYIRHIAV